MKESEGIDVKLMDIVRFDKNGLIPAITQDYETGKVLMLAYMNKESLEVTLKERKACYWSRSRQELWLKGATSGNFQEVMQISIDCDADAILLKVKQKGGACHVGYYSCFYRQVENDNSSLSICDKLVFDAEEVYGKSNKK
ncbi:Phosphoribosyl-AMP cyclohydrolase [Chloroherpeton thalassium ATCC 35110]|uniref:Phosphoribosyl-AMP cyclohydrolase n=1 Tax=Chloroherpeton thalassium (strain ATCC 35110 / GB-78) TaxID=517418 RepID=HIS3_CHLT3|nr:phosphoribosyl-AMP cyclohydrolase [Chloroherpeton thalassium]B3QU88.1 RecName: Full=Phosphoribosyl-AMP cyclohydrolase; Short=PRA-CH [Chloroherpeton thalassium ATCC 35110]ACF14337.1 Phosphoribosyl-AMP cyclohydrolase [Chloroherpeton thalassium ATCC 35110]